MGKLRNLLFANKNIDRRGDPLNDPAIPLSSPAAWELFGQEYQTESGEVITVQNSLQITTVFACVRVIAESVATMPLIMKERLQPSGQRDAIEQNLYYLLSTEPNPEMSAYTFFESLTGSAVLTGNGYAQIERNNNGQPVALWPLHPFKTTPKRDPKTNTIYFETTDGMPAGTARKIAADDVLHISTFSFDGLKGISPIDACRRTLGLAVAQEKAGARHFGNGSRPGGLLMNKGAKMDVKALQELRQSWEAQQGAINQGRLAILPTGDWTYQALSISNENSQWLESRGFSQAQIAGMFRVPPNLIGDQSKLSGSNSEQMSLQFINYCLQPYISRIESEVARKLMPTAGRHANRFFVRFDESALVRLDFATQMEGYQAGIIGGWYTANEIRRKLGENPGGPELDIFRMPVNYTNAINMIADGTEQQDPPPDDDTDLTTSERKLLAQSVAETPTDVAQAYRKAYFVLFQDAFQRVMKRSKLDLGAFNTVFRPVLECISNMAVGFRDGNVEGQDPDVTNKLVDDVLKSMAKRAEKWNTQDLQLLIANEFNKAVRSIHIGVSKSIAAKKAAEQLNMSEDFDETN